MLDLHANDIHQKQEKSKESKERYETAIKNDTTI